MLRLREAGALKVGHFVKVQAGERSERGRWHPRGGWEVVRKAWIYGFCGNGGGGGETKKNERAMEQPGEQGCIGREKLVTCRAHAQHRHSIGHLFQDTRSYVER